MDPVAVPTPEVADMPDEPEEAVDVGETEPRSMEELWKTNEIFKILLTNPVLILLPFHSLSYVRAWPWV